jgi:type IV pilus assembly protein PilB
MARRRRKLGEILLQWGQLTEKQLEEATKLTAGSGKKVGEILVELNFASEADVTRALASQHELEYVDLDRFDIDKDAISLLPVDVIRKYKVLPLGQSGGKLKVLIHDPLDLDTLDKLRFRMNCEIDTALAAKSKIYEYIDRVFGETKKSIDATMNDLSVDRSGVSVDVASIDGSLDIQGLSIDARKASMDIAAAGGGEAEEATQAPVIRLVNRVIAEAVSQRASDIHIEPFVDRVRLRYRIDGECVERDAIPKRVQAAVIARLKIMSGMRIEEKRIPQDGRIKLRIGNKPYDFRVSACPAYHGESMVLRILRPEAARIGLVNLGMREDTLQTFNKVIRRPNGIFLVTGPTGSGKTTTLYTALDVLNRPDKKIITAEDPVEYNFKGINQCQVNESIGLSFALILRAMLRQAPNVVLVGEIRDKEVADVAIQAALTGHLVFSTLHTNDAASAITRLIDMGVKPFLVASSIQAVLAQRLVRILCEYCKQPDPTPNERLLRVVGLSKADVAGRTLYKAVGCPKCNNAGFHGRRGVYELMIMNGELRDLAFKRAPLNQIRAASLASGTRNLLGDGRLKVLDGTTTPEEIAKIAQVEGILEGEADEAA